MLAKIQPPEIDITNKKNIGTPIPRGSPRLLEIKLPTPTL